MAKNEVNEIQKEFQDFFSSIFAISVFIGIASTVFLKSKYVKKFKEFVPYAQEGQIIGFGLAVLLVVMYYIWSLRATLLQAAVTSIKYFGRVICLGMRRIFLGTLNLGRFQKEQTQDQEIIIQAEEEFPDLPNPNLLPQQPKAAYEKTGEKIAKTLPIGFRRIGVDDNLIQGIKVIKAVDGPASALIEIKLPDGFTISKLESMVKDLISALGIPSLQVIAGSEPARAGLVVGHHNRVPVYLRALFESSEFLKARRKMKMPVPIGVDPTGKIIFEDLTKFPHALIAGATNSGKSVWLSAVIYTLAYNLSPWQLQMVLIDPKKVEFPLFENFPHVLTIETDPQKSVAKLALAVDEMDRRYDLFHEAKVKNIEAYNGKAKSNKQLPFLVIVIDELSDLMLTTNRVALEGYITRLGQLARAAGIHLILATQRPEVGVITGIIKANLPTRICFSLSTQADYATVFGPGANYLLRGFGDGIARIEGRLEGLLRFQGPIISTKDLEVEESIEKLGRYWREKCPASDEDQGGFDKGILEKTIITSEQFDEEDEITLCDDDLTTKSTEDSRIKTQTLEYQVCLRIIDTIEKTPEGKDIYISANRIRSEMGKSPNDIQAVFDRLVSKKLVTPEKGKGYKLLDEEGFYRLCDEFEKKERI